MHSTEGKGKYFVGVNKEEDELENSCPFTLATSVMHE